MTLMVLGGRGEYRNPVATNSPLWRFFPPPNAQNTVIIYQDGTVLEKPSPLDRETIASTVTGSPAYLVIYGGDQAVFEDTSFAYLSLLAAGYQFTERPYPDTYTEDYGDTY